MSASFVSSMQFLSTPSARRATEAEYGSKTPEEYFYPRPPRGGRHSRVRHRDRHIRFLSTPSARRATEQLAAERMRKSYFYPRPPRGGRHA